MNPKHLKLVEKKSGNIGGPHVSIPADPKPMQTEDTTRNLRLTYDAETRTIRALNQNGTLATEWMLNGRNTAADQELIGAVRSGVLAGIRSAKITAERIDEAIAATYASLIVRLTSGAVEVDNPYGWFYWFAMSTARRTLQKEFTRRGREISACPQTNVRLLEHEDVHTAPDVMMREQEREMFALLIHGLYTADDARGDLPAPALELVDKAESVLLALLNPKQRIVLKLAQKGFLGVEIAEIITRKPPYVSKRLAEIRGVLEAVIRVLAGDDDDGPWDGSPGAPMRRRVRELLKILEECQDAVNTRTSTGPPIEDQRGQINEEIRSKMEGSMYSAFRDVVSLVAMGTLSLPAFNEASPPAEPAGRQNSDAVVRAARSLLRLPAIAALETHEAITLPKRRRHQRSH